MAEAITDHTAIRFQQDNPKRAGTKAHERYDLYKGARTVGEALRLGAVKGDIPNDIKKGHCSREGTGSAKQLSPVEELPKGPSPKKAAQGPTPKKRDAKALSDGAAVAPEAKRLALEVPPAAQADVAIPANVQRAQPPQLHSAPAVQVADPVSAQPAQPQPPADVSGPDLASAQAPQPHPAPSAHEAVVAQAPQPLPAPSADEAVVASAAPLQPQSAPSSGVAVPASTQPPQPQLAASTGEVASSCAGAVAGAEGASSSVAASPTPQAVPRATPYEVDLSFAKLEGKPIKFIKRAMGEAKKLLSERGLAESKEQGLDVSLRDRDNLSKYAVTVSDLNEDGQLCKDLKRLGLEAGIDLEISLPDGFPLEPPFVRVVYPQLTGGFVFHHGGICFEPLTMKGWAPSMTIASLCISIKGILDFGEVRCAGVGDKVSRTVPGYTEEGARKDHSAISRAHQGGDAKTYQRYTKS